ncbi:hypothetical protein LP123_02230 [Moraxella bovis]|uniref:Lipoprotein n=1 Tax=Moraxella bovis TaxID=476 RepID=A0AAX3ETG0_MORBO|nr:hypothetical protein [Moraxella bovis]AWY21179.1 hypothetical protein DQF64_12230 [Moraxella bovis]OOR87819.1 hypothetical protein B0182_11310 [Moraxella bovis]UYZ81594.1 hypothetical protein LP113_02260 [Moraxella bovis]UYZ89125.1 hypothetical protein LP114_12030 [Moraxella bovis]UYZ95779.1 hypothetical protein LP121_04260 [Moraxella bovis]
MKTKAMLILSILLSSALTLTACNPLKGYGQEAGAGGSKRSGLQNARGDDVWGCQGEKISGLGFLDRYGLPREIGGNFICENGKPKLPKDCQGREIRSEAEFIAFWEKHQFPIGLPYYDCVNGIPKVKAEHLQYWKTKEKYNPTCKDSRGRKRPCV